MKIISAKPLKNKTQILKQHLYFPRWFWPGTSLSYLKSWVASILGIAKLDLRAIWQEKVSRWQHIIVQIEKQAHSEGEAVVSLLNIWNICIVRDGKSQELWQAHLKTNICESENQED